MSRKKKGDRVWDSISAAAGALGISKTTLQDAKNRGCPAFVDGRVHEKDLGEWISVQPPPDGRPKSLRDQKTEEEIRKLRIANDAKEGKSELKSVTVARIHRIGHEITTYLGAVAKEKPAVLAMTTEDIPRVRIEFQKVCDEMLRKFQSFAELWGVKL